MDIINYFLAFTNRVKYIIIPFAFYSLYILYSFNLYEFVRELENTLTSLILLLFVYYLIKELKFAKYYYIITSFVVAFVQYLKIAFYEVYGYKISKSLVYTILETYGKEVDEYLSTNLNINIIVYTIIFFCYLFFLIKDFRNNNNLIKNRNVVMSSLFVVVISFILYRGFHLRKYNFTYTVASSIYDFKKTHDAFDSKLKSKTNSLFKYVSKTSIIPKIYVVVIGESTTRGHMGLYGYKRNTNPLLTEKNKNLKLYNNVFSTSAWTIFSLNHILLHKKKEIGYFDHLKENDIKASIVQLANMAGFKTYWLSNQRQIGANETSTSKIASAADKSIFVNYEDYDFESYDEKILPELDNLLKDNAPHKMIFIHLMGAHWNFIHRYPSNFNKFTDVPPTKINDKKKQQIINEYDNAIRYNDFIVNSVIDKVSDTNTEAYVTYFSDHGVDVFENVTKAIEHSDRNPTKPMYEIPFLVWMSDGYKKNNTFNYYPNRIYVMGDFIHSFSELSNIEFSEIDLTKSIFSNEYNFDKQKIINTRLEKIIYD
ncbi:MAG: hypothetical protein COA88_07510 [Kordia sp.]|nr:MAG: hypothetical protein COA88_07510 [Kordia sp.]